MKRLLIVMLVMLAYCEGIAFGFTDADSPSFDCSGYSNQYVRMTFNTIFQPRAETVGNGNIVKVKFSTGMSGKDTDITFVDGQTLGAIITLEGYCQGVNGQAYLNTHWSLDSGVDGSAYDLIFEPVLKISRL